MIDCHFLTVSFKCFPWAKTSQVFSEYCFGMAKFIMLSRYSRWCPGTMSAVGPSVAPYHVGVPTSRTRIWKVRGLTEFRRRAQLSGSKFKVQMWVLLVSPKIFDACRKIRCFCTNTFRRHVVFLLLVKSSGTLLAFQMFFDLFIPGTEPTSSQCVVITGTKSLGSSVRMRWPWWQAPAKDQYSPSHCETFWRAWGTLGHMLDWHPTQTSLTHP